MRKRSIGLTLILAVVMMFAVQVSAASSVAVNLRADQKTAESACVLLDARNMYCEVTSASKYPIKFQACGRTQADGIVNDAKTIVYNVNAKGTVAVSTAYNYYSIKLTGWKVNSSVSGCIGYGKLY